MVGFIYKCLERHCFGKMMQEKGQDWSILLSTNGQQHLSLSKNQNPRQVTRALEIYWCSLVGDSEAKNPPAVQETPRCGFDPWVRKIPWRRKWQNTLVILPGTSHSVRSLAGYSPWNRVGYDWLNNKNSFLEIAIWYQFSSYSLSCTILNSILRAFMKFPADKHKFLLKCSQVYAVIKH